MISDTTRSYPRTLQSAFPHEYGWADAEVMRAVLDVERSASVDTRPMAADEFISRFPAECCTEIGHADHPRPSLLARIRTACARFMRMRRA